MGQRLEVVSDGEAVMALSSPILSCLSRPCDAALRRGGRGALGAREGRGQDAAAGG